MIALSPWAYVVLAGLLIIDGFFPLVPGETTVVALATLGAAGHGPPVWSVFIIAVVATMTGDAITFFLGRRTGLSRWRWMRGARISTAITRASAAVSRRPARALIGAKFIPFVRVIVSLTAGAAQLPVAKYCVISLAASTVYTGYHVIVAVTAGSYFAANPVIGVVASLVSIIVISALIEGVRALRSRTATG